MHRRVDICHFVSFFFAVPVLLLVNYINYQDQSDKTVSYSDNRVGSEFSDAASFLAMIQCTASIYVSKILSRARLLLASVTFWRLEIVEPEMLKLVSLDEHSSQSIYYYYYYFFLRTVNFTVQPHAPEVVRVGVRDLHRHPARLDFASERRG